MALRVVFMGTPAFAVPALQALIDSEHEVVALYSQPPRKANRGHKETPSPTHQLAESADIPVHVPTSLKSDEVQQEFRAHKADIAVVAAYGLLLPKPILEAYPHGCINIHPSDLPRWRGAAPLHRTVLAGDEKTAMCIMQMDEGLDTGDVLYREAMDVPQHMTTGELHDLMADKGAAATLEVLQLVEKEALQPTPQPEEGVTYASKLDKSESSIDWNQPAETIYNQIRGLNPWPSATARFHDEVLKIHSADVVPEAHDSAPGTLLDDALTVACGTNALRLRTLQRPNKRAMQAEELLRGFAMPAGERFG